MAKKTSVTWTKVDPQGRVVIPAEIRAEMGIEPGKPIAFIIEADRLGLITVRQGIKIAQERLARHIKKEPGRSIVDEFLAERRAEAERE
ncbi:MAG TPA: AbrB/MazE/SpoVT family DNA-binding domain-containing protein [Dehalococcoidia bacterium]|nr:AbrB/MazE/SpoVT family DNA-binding domain-containing protein [Dehalococcoidia bacterium]